MEFPSCYGSSDLLGNSIAVERVCGGGALGAWSDTTSERLHSYGISQLTRPSHPLRNSIASVNALAGLPVIASPCSPGMRHKTGFFIGCATPAGRSGLMPVGDECYSYGISQLCPAVRQGGRCKPQPWRAGAAAVRAMERFIACYGIPEQAQPHMAGSSPFATLRADVSSAARRPQWHESGGVAARDG
jgi:hypothetical protein